MSLPAMIRSTEVRSYENDDNQHTIAVKASKLVELKGKPDPIPFELKMYKGMKSYRIPRIFVEFLLHHPVSLAFIERCKWMLVTSGKNCSEKLFNSFNFRFQTRV